MTKIYQKRQFWDKGQKYRFRVGGFSCPAPAAAGARQGNRTHECGARAKKISPMSREISFNFQDAAIFSDPPAGPRPRPDGMRPPQGV